MKQVTCSRLFFCGFIWLALGALTASAQTNFWWTNNANGVWNGGANWTNETVSGLPPNNGGSNDFGLVFQNTSAVVTTNNAATPNFLLNQLQFAAGAGVVTIFAGAGTNLVFTNSTGGVLPQFIQNSANNVTNNIGFVLATNTAFLGTGAGSVLLNSTVSGTGGLLMGGSYTLLLNASNSYAGGTVITNGTAKVGVVGAFTNYWAFGTARMITVTNGGTLDINGVNIASNYNVTISGAGVNSNGALVSSVAIVGGLTNLTLTGDAVVGGAQRLDVRSFAGQGLVNLNGFKLTKTGSAQFSIVGDLVTDGNIDVNGGILSLESTTVATGGVGVITINNGGTLMPYSTTAGNITRRIVANGGVLQLGTGAAGGGTIDSLITLQSNLVLSAQVAFTLNGAITGAYGVVKIGSAVATLAGASTYSGGTIISNGVIQLSGGINRLFTNGDLTVASGAGLDINGQTQTVNALMGAGVITNNSTSAASLTLGNNFAATSNAVFTGSLISSGHVFNVTKVGPGTQTLFTASGANMILNANGGVLVLTGGSDNASTVLNVTNGVLILDKQSANNVHAAGGGASILNIYAGGVAQMRGSGNWQIYSQGMVTVNSGGILDMNGRNEDFDRLTGGGLVINSATTAATLQLGDFGGSTNFAGNITDNAANGGTLALVKVGNGTLGLAGLNTYAGGTTLRGGELGISLDANIGGNTNAITFAGGLLQINGTAMHSLGVHVFNAGSFSGGVDVASIFNAFIISTNLGGSGSLIKSGLGTLALEGTETYTGGTTVSNGTLRLAAGNNTLSSNSPITVTGGTLDLVGGSQTTTRVVSFQGGIMQNGSLTVADSNVVAAAGVAAVNLTLQGNATLTKTTGGILTLLGSNNTLTNNLNAGELAVVSDANLGGVTSVINFGGGLLQVLGSALTTVDGRTINWNSMPYGSGFDIANASNTFIIGSVVGGGSSLTKAGPGTLVLDSANTYSGPTIINGGVLQVDNGGTSGTLGMGNITNNATLVFDRANSYTVSNNISGTGGLVQLSAGTTLLAGTNTYAGTTLVSAGTLTFAAPGSNAIGAVQVTGGAAGATLNINAPVYINGGNDIKLGATVGDRSTMIINTNLLTSNSTTSSHLYIGNAAGANGAVIQNGGTVLVGIALQNQAVLDLGANSGYGYYQMNGGALSAGQIGLGGGTGSKNLGVFDLNGGSVTGVQWVLFSYAASSTGVLNIANGKLTVPTGGQIKMNWSGGNDFDMLNILTNGMLDASYGTLDMNYKAVGAGPGSFINLNNGGTLAAQQILASFSGTNILGFNGGTLRASANSGGFISNLSAVVIYSGGGTLDSSNFNITIAQNLLAPSGNGVTNIALASGGVGYIGAPVVTITGGGGTGATAIAQVDLNTNDVAYGTITNLLITSYGVGYTGTPTVVLSGGGFTSAATINSISLAANATTGALSKQGNGLLTLSGTNSYGGGTFINNGLLAFATTNAIPATPALGGITIGSGGALVMTGAFASANAWLAGGDINTNSTGALALTPANAGESIDFTAAAGGAYSNLFVGAAPGLPVLYNGTLTFYNGNYQLGGGGGTLIITNAISGNNLTAGLPGVATNTTVWLENASFSTITLNNSNTLSIANNLGGGALTINGGTLQVRGSSLNNLSSLNLTTNYVGGNLAFDINYAGNTFTIDTNLTINGSLAKQGGLGTLVLSGSNTFGSVILSAGALNLQNNDALGGISTLTVASGMEVQLQGGVTITNALTVAGGGAFVNDGAVNNISGTNTWAGPITETAATRYDSASGLLILSGTLNNGGQSVVLGGNGNLLISGAITNTGALSKDGDGMLTLAGSNTYTGATTVNAGGLILNFNAAGAPVNNIIATNSVLTLNGSALQMVSAGSGVNTQQFTSTSIGNNLNSIVATSTGSGTNVLVLGAITSAGGGAVNFTLPANGVITTTSGTNNGIIGGWATVGGTDWATIVGASPYAITNYTAYTTLAGANPNIVSGSISNIRINSSSTGPVGLTGNTIINTLVDQDPASRTNSLGGFYLSTIGLLEAAGAGNLTIGSAPNDGRLTSSGSLYLENYSSGTLTINSVISNGANAVQFIGTGAFVLNGTNSSAGSTVYVEGTPQVTFTSTNALGAINQRGGTLTFSSTSSNSLGAVTVGGGYGAATLNINGPTTLGGSILNAGTVSWDRDIINVTTNLTAYTIQLGNVVNSAAALYQTGGTVYVTSYTGIGANGSGSQSYGYYLLTGGGSFRPQQYLEIGTYGYGVMDVVNGTLVGSTNTFALDRRTAGAGLLNVYSGGTVLAPSNGNSIVLGYSDYAGNGYAVLNILGGVVNAANGITNKNINLNVTTGAGSIGVLNLNNGGLLIADSVGASQSSLSVLNFNNGILQAATGTANSATFLQGLGGAYIYGGGATIDTTNVNLTIAQNLNGVTGYGIAGIAVSNGGGGYMGSTQVKITGGSGTGATAFAQVDLNAADAAYGQITNILITSAGSGYLPNDTISVQLLGGGYTNAAMLGAITWAPNANTGGLTMLGSGTLTLSNVNTYGGMTVISNGTLAFQPAATATNVIGGLGGSGALQHNGLGMTIFNGSGATFTGAATINTGVVQFANFDAVPVYTNVTINAAGTVAFDFGGGTVQTALNNGITYVSTGVIALTPNSAGETVNFNTPGMSSAYLGAVGAVSYDLANFTPAVAGIYQLGGGGGTLNLTNTPITTASSVTIGNGVNPGTVVFNAANTYNGGTVVNPGGTLAAGAANTFSPNSTLTVSNGAQVNLAGYNQAIGALAGGAGTILNTNGAVVLMVGSNGVSTLFGGSINGNVGLTKVGAGTLTLTNFNVYNGPTLVSAGTLQLTPNGANSAGLTEAWTNGTSSWTTKIFNGTNGVVSSARFNSGYWGTSGGATPIWPTTWPASTTIAYLGYVYNNTGSNVTWTFASVCDDGSQLAIDGVLVINNQGGTTYQKNNVVLTPGAHVFDYRISNGAGGAGGGSNSAYQLFGGGYGYLGGFAYDPLGLNSANGALYQVPLDTGNGTFFTSGMNILPGSTVVQIAPGATLDLNGAQQIITGLSDPFAAMGAGGFVTNSQTATPAMLTLSPQGGSNYLFSGNITDAGTANAISIMISGPGSETFAGTNTYSGGTTINGGMLQFAQASAVSPNSNILINAGGVAAFNFTGIQSSGVLARINTTSAGALALLATNAAENLDFNTPGLANLYLGAVGNIVYGGTFTNFAGVTRLGGGGGTLTFNQQITNGMVYINPVGGAGTVVLGNIGNSYTGTVINAGTLQIGSDAVLGGTISGGATNLTFAGASTLLAGANNISLNANRSILVASNTTVRLNDNGYTFSINGNLAGGGYININTNNSTLFVGGAGTLNLNSPTVTNLNIVLNTGTLAVTNNPVLMNGGLISIGSNAADRSVVKVNQNFAYSGMILGSGAGAAGAFYQSGGVVSNITGGSGWQLTTIGAGAVSTNPLQNGYGYYRIDNGTALFSETMLGGAFLNNNSNGGNGVLEINGGSVVIGALFEINRLSYSKEYSVVNVSGGSLATLGNPALNGQNGSTSSGPAAGGQAVINISGGVVDFATNSNSRVLEMMPNTTASPMSVVNLNGGQLVVNKIQATGAIGQSILNFNGGTLLASNGTSAGSTFLQGLSAAVVYPGGANIDTTNNTITINQMLVSPAAYGVTGIAIADGGAGYIGAPVVVITGGSGTGATAYAQVDLISGTVTNIQITSYGSGYQPGDVLTVQLAGGGATSPAGLGTVTLGANSSSGGLTKYGSGTLILGGNNTYLGNTVVSNGNLQIGSGGASGSLAGQLVMPNTNSWLGFNRSDLFFTNNFNSSNLQTPNGNLTALVQNGANILVLTNAAPVYNSTIISNGAVLFATPGAIPNNTVGGAIVLANGGGVAVGGAYGAAGWLGSGLIATNNNQGTLALLQGGNSENISLGVYSNLYLGAAQGQVATFLGTLTPATGTTNFLVGGGGGTLVIGTANAFTDNGVLTNFAVLVGNSVTSTVQVLGPQNYTGGTFITNATLSVSADNNLGYGGITLRNNGILQITNAPNNFFATIKPVTLASGTSVIEIDGSVTGAFYGVFSGPSALQKMGSGTLEILGAFNPTAAGAALTNVNAGLLWLANGSSLNNNNGNSDLNAQSGATIQVDSNTTAYVQTLRINNNGATAATYNQTGGSVTAKQWFVLGQNANNVGIANLTGGSLVYDAGLGAYSAEIGSSGNGTLNITNATLTGLGTGGAAGILYVAHVASTTGTVNQGTGSVVTLTTGTGGLIMAPATNSSATYNLGVGSLLITPKISSGYGNVGGSSTGTWAAVFNFNGGTLQSDSNNATFMQGLSAANINAGGAFIDSSNFNITIANKLLGTGVLTKQGVGTLILSGTNNTYTGGSVVNAGTLWFTTNAAMGTGTTALVTINTAGTLAAAGNVGSLYTNVTSWLGSGKIVTNSSGALGLISNSVENVSMVFSNLYLGVASGSNVQYSGTLTPTNNFYRLAAGFGGNLQMINTNALTGSYGLLVNGPGVVTLASSNNYLGGTLINSGATLLLSNNAAAGTVVAGITNLSGGVLAAGYALDPTTLTNLARNSAGVIALAANSTSNLDFSAATGANLTNVYLGAYGATAWTNSGTLTPFGSTYQLGGGGGTLVITNSGALTGAGYNLIAFGGGSGGNLILNGTNIFGGGTVIGALGTATVATVSLGTGNVTNNGLLVINNNNVVGNLNNNVSGSGTLLVTNASATNTMVTLSGSNTYTGLTIIAANSYVVLSNTNGGMVVPGNLQIGTISSQNAYVRLGGNQQMSSSTVISFMGSGISVGRLCMLGFSQTVAGLNDPGAAGLIDNADNIANGWYSDSNAAPSTLTVNNSANYVYAGYLRSYGNLNGPSNTLALVKDGAGQQTLVGVNITYNGPTTVKNGVLALSNTTAFASPVTITGGQLLLATPGNTTAMSAMLTNNANDGVGFSGGNAFTIGGLAGSGGITLWSQTGGGVALTIGGNNASTLYAGVLSDAGPGNYYQGTLLKIGNGALILSGDNTYNGPTLVSGGILAADFGVGLPPATYLQLTNASLGSFTGLITNSLGTGAGQINILGGNAGFSAVNSNTLVSLGGLASPTTLVWSNTAGFMPVTLVLNDTNANAILTFANALDLNGANRTIGVNASNGVVNFVGALTNSSAAPAAFTKTGPGVLVMTNAANINIVAFTNAGGALIADFGLGLNANTNLTLNGGTYGSPSGLITNTLGIGPGQINIAGGASGFTSYGSNAIVSLGGLGTPTTLVWSNTPNFNPSALVLNDLGANANISLINSLDLNGGARTITVRAGTAYLVNGFTNSQPSIGGGLTKNGFGSLVVSNGLNTVILSNAFYVSQGTFELASGTIISSNAAAYDYVGNGAGDSGKLILSGNAVFTRYRNQLNLGGGANSLGVMVITNNAQYNGLGGWLQIGNSGTGILYMAGGSLTNTVSGILVGDGANTSVGALYHTAGNIYNVGEFDVGYQTAAPYGYYQMSGGTLSNSTWVQAGRFGMGVIYQNGGSIGIASSGLIVGNQNGTGIVYLTGGTMTTPAIYLSRGVSPTSRGELTVAGNANVTVNGDVVMNYVVATNIFNLNGGVVQANHVYKNVAGGLSIFNFNGGTLRAGANNVTLMGSGAGGVGAMDAAYVWGGNAIIDLSNNFATISQNLLAPTGSGVVINASSLSLGGYVGAPIVAINGGGGTGATAVALFDYTSGTVTGIVVTSAGVGYTSTPTVTFTRGGHGDYTLDPGTVSLALNTSGGLTILGADGMLALSGTNTFTGGINLISGGVMFNNTNALPPGVTSLLVPYGASLGVTNNAGSLFGGGTSNLLASGFVDLNSSGTIALAYSTPATETINFNAQGYTNMSLGAAKGFTVTNLAPLYTVNNAYRLGGGGGTLALTNVDMLTGGNALLAFGSGSGGALALYASNSFSGGTVIGYQTGTVQLYNAYGLSTGPVTNNGALSFNNASPTTNIISMISGSGIVVQANQAVNMLTSNSYSGGTWLTSGNGGFYLGDDNALGSGTIWVTGLNPTLASTGFVTRTLANNIVLSNNVTYGTAGNNGSLLLNGNMDLGGGMRTQTVSAAVIINGIISNGGLTKAGASNLTLTAANNYAGGTVIMGGTLSAGAPYTLSPNSAIIVTNDASANYGTLDLNGTSETIAGLAVGTTNLVVTNLITIASGQTLAVNGSFTVGAASPTNSWSNLKMLGGGALVVTGAAANVSVGINQITGNQQYNYALLNLAQLGSVTLGASNNPLTALNVGYGNGLSSTLVLSDTNNFIAATTVQIGNSTQNNGPGGGLILGAGPNVIEANTIYIGVSKATGTVQFASQAPGSPGTVVITGLSNSAANIWIGFKNGTGTGAYPTNTLDLRGHNATVTAGNLNIGFENGGSGTGGELSSLLFDSGTFTVTNLNMAYKTNVSTGGVKASLTVSGGVFTVTSGGSFTLASQTGSAFANGTLNVLGGTFQSYAPILDGGGTSTTTVNLAGGTLDMTGANIGTAGTNIDAFNLQSGTLQNLGEFNGGVTPLVKTTSGTLVMSNNTYTGGTTNLLGTLALGSSGALGSGVLVMNGGALAVTNGGGWTEVNNVSLVAPNSVVDTTGGNLTLSGALTNSGALTKQGPGTLTLSGVNTYTGVTTINAGTLQFAQQAALYNNTPANWTAANIIVASNAVLALNVGGTGEFIDTDVQTLSGLGTAGGGFANGSFLGLDTSNAGGNFNYAHVIADPNGGANSLGLVKLGPGALTLGAVNTYSGSTIISNGTIQLGVANALPTATQLYADTLGTLDLAGLNQTVGGVNGSKGTLTDSIGGGTLTVNFANAQSFQGTMTGPGNLTLTGGGTMNLLGTNSFSGNTIVSNASYYVNGLHSGGLITVLSNGLVGGSAPISALYVDNGGTYAPGNSIATQKVGSLTLINAGLLAIELGNNANDQVIVTNSLTIAGGQLKLNLAAYSFIPNATITLVDWTTASGFAPNNPAQWFTLSDAGGPNNGMVWSNGVLLAVSGGTGSNNFFTINYDDLANGVASTHGITLTAVPEPGTASLLGLMGVAFLIRRLRQRKHRAA